MIEKFDLVVVGAGPGGLAAAATAAEAGMRTCMIDDNPTPGGQIWRGGVAPKNTGVEASRWLRRIERSRVEMRMGWRVVAYSTDIGKSQKILRIEQSGRFADIESSALVLASGARELFLPFPGWTLPGVFGAGGLQAFVKSGLDVRGKRIVIAGTGPLLLAVAAGLRAAGASIVSIVEQAPILRLARFSLGLTRRHIGKLAEGAGYAIRIAGVSYRMGAWVTSASGSESLEKVAIRCDSGLHEIEVDMLAIGYHLVPNTELAQLLRCELEGGFVRVDALQQTSVERIYCVGELTGIGGVVKAQIEGRIAGLAVSGQSHSAKALIRSRDHQIQFANSLAATFALREELRTLANNETLICRCEDVAHSAISSCNSWREAKLHTRCGMGPCQGRVCGPIAQFLFGWETPHPRPPLFPVDVETLADAHQDADLSNH